MPGRRRAAAALPCRFRGGARLPGPALHHALTSLPKHVISGDEDDTWTAAQPEDMAIRLRAHRTVLAGTGHSPNLQRPAETAGALIGFWSGVRRDGGDAGPAPHQHERAAGA